jgi:hypothetical protein
VKDSSPSIWAISAIFKKLPKENNRLLGKNSPILVTLLPTKEFFAGIPAVYVTSADKAALASHTDKVEILEYIYIYIYDVPAFWLNGV